MYIFLFIFMFSETKEKSVPRENSISDSEENSAVKDLDHSIGDTDNQVQVKTKNSTGL